MSARVLRQLAEDGLEDLGTMVFSGTLVVADLAAFATGGAQTRFDAVVRPGTWFTLGRPYEGNADLLEEIVLVHEAELGAFYRNYDDLVDAATVRLPHHRLVVLAGGRERDVELLKSLSEPEELPWMADDGAMAVTGIGELPAQIIASPGAPLQMLAIGLRRPPKRMAGTHVPPRDAH